jgi:hypothetical protein
VTIIAPGGDGSATDFAAPPVTSWLASQTNCALSRVWSRGKHSYFIGLFHGLRVTGYI